MRLGVAVLRTIAVWLLVFFIQSLLFVVQLGTDDKTRLAYCLIAGLVSGFLWIYAREVVASIKSASPVDRGLRYGVLCYLALTLPGAASNAVAFFEAAEMNDLQEDFLKALGTSPEASFVATCFAIMAAIVFLMLSRKIGAFAEQVETVRLVREEIEHER
jgi:hypothetical protein